MSQAANGGLLAIDVGTSRVKLGWFPNAVACDADKPSQLPIAVPRLPEPVETFACRYEHFGRSFAFELGDQIEQLKCRELFIVMASVNPSLARTVEYTLREHGLTIGRELQVSDLPIRVAVKEPERVGIDRVLAAVAVNRIRTRKTPAFIISLGTACTVNVVSPNGEFQGGAILPGPVMAARALQNYTDSLPLVSLDDLSVPENGIGKNTREAISAGIYWGTLGALEKLIHEQSRSLFPKPQLFLTGGDAELVVEALKSSGHAVRVIPHLVLSGIAIACEAQP